MGLEQGIPKAAQLSWAYRHMVGNGAFTYVVYDAAMEQVFFTVRAGNGVERRYRLTIELGRPVVQQVEGPPETR
jgi:hypothetical protein